MRRQLVPAIVGFLVFTFLLGIVYPLVVTGIAQVAFPGRADGSLVERDGQVVGSSLIGRLWEGNGYFQPRASAAGDGYDPQASSASNLGPSNPDFLEAVEKRAAAYRKQNDVAGELPVDAVTASGSGLDPHISPRNARLQAPRVARARGLELTAILGLIERHTDGRSLGFLGEPGVNVLGLNLALDEPA